MSEWKPTAWQSAWLSIPERCNKFAGAVAAGAKLLAQYLTTFTMAPSTAREHGA
jgi:hypothetical protein